MEGNLRDIFAVIWGQCSTLIQGKIKDEIGYMVKSKTGCKGQFRFTKQLLSFKSDLISISGNENPLS